MGLHTFGQLLLWWAFGLNVLAGFGFLMLARGRKDLESLARLSYHALAVVTSIAVALLFYLFFSHNFAFKYVFEYSDRSLPFFFLLSAFWGGQEGTYLLWLFLSVLFGYIILRRSGQYRNWAMTVYTAVNFFFATMLLKVSPFVFLDFYAADGAGLNPLLQDAWMVIHPPVMFVGYALAAVPFAIAMSALINKKYDTWVRRVCPWAVLTAFMLAAGNILGGYWAYKTLGWGGYWAWDPVENSSLIPWFVSLALLHGLIIERRTGALTKTNILLAAFTFWLVVYGTFLTRSGVLADFSVHSFVDLGQNVYLVAFLAVFAALTLALFVPRIKSTASVPISYSFFGREFSLFGAMVLLFLFSMVVLVWSSLPILTKLVGAEPRAADIATYNSFALPMAIIYALLLTISPLTTYATAGLPGWPKKLAVGGLVSLVLGIVIAAVSTAGAEFVIVFTIVLTGLYMAMSKPELMRRLVPAVVLFAVTIVLSLVIGLRDYTHILLFGTAAAAIGSNVLGIIRYIPNQWRVAGAHITHFGFGLMLIGILASSGYDSSDRIQLSEGRSGSTYGLDVTFNGMASTIETPKNELLLEIDDNGSSDLARPQLYFSERMQGLMKRPYIRRTAFYDLYFSPQDLKEGRGQDGLVIGKTELVRAGDYQFRFVDFRMGEHGAGDGNMQVTAEVIAIHGDHADTLRPGLTMITGQDGSSTLMEQPAEFGHGSNTYMMTIKRILADQGAVLVDIPGLVDQHSGDQLLLDISRKPLINLVWVGTTLILLGSLIVFVRRRREAVA